MSAIVAENRGIHTVQGRGAWHAVTFSSVPRPISLPSRLFTLFMRPSEDRTSQTIVIYQHKSIISWCEKAHRRSLESSDWECSSTGGMCLAGLAARELIPQSKLMIPADFPFYHLLKYRGVFVVRGTRGRSKKGGGISELTPVARSVMTSSEPDRCVDLPIENPHDCEKVLCGGLDVICVVTCVWFVEAA